MIEAGIAYQVHGEGLPVVLLHGAAGTQLSWPAQVRRLPGQARLRAGPARAWQERRRALPLDRGD